MFVQVFFGLESFDVCTSTKLPPNLPASKTPFLVGVGGGGLLKDSRYKMGIEENW